MINKYFIIHEDALSLYKTMYNKNIYCHYIRRMYNDNKYFYYT